jgi:hypothetical protein
VPILDDKRPALLEGSEEGTISDYCKYRRADWAYRFITLIMGRPYQFFEDPAARDQQIKAVKKMLTMK